MEEIKARSALIIKRLRAQLGFSASTVTAYCEKQTTDIFGRSKRPIEQADSEFYGMSDTLSDIADAIARLCEELWSNALTVEENDPSTANAYRAKAQAAIAVAELFEELSVSVYRRISRSSQFAEINVAEIRRQAAGFIVHVNNAVKVLSEE